MKISGGDHLVVTHTWSKNYFSNIKLTGLKVDCPKMPLSQNAPVSPTSFYIDRSSKGNAFRVHLFILLLLDERRLFFSLATAREVKRINPL